MFQLREAETIALGNIRGASILRLGCGLDNETTCQVLSLPGSQVLFPLNFCFPKYRAGRGSCARQEQISWCRFCKSISIKLSVVLLRGALGLGGNVHPLRTSQPPKRLRQLFQKCHWLVGAEGGPGEFLGHHNEKVQACLCPSPHLLSHLLQSCSHTVTRVIILKCKSQA